MIPTLSLKKKATKTTTMTKLYTMMKMMKKF